MPTASTSEAYASDCRLTHGFFLVLWHALLIYLSENWQPADAGGLVFWITHHVGSAYASIRQQR